MLREQLIEKEILHADQLVEAPMAELEDILRVHEKSYVMSFCEGTISPKEVRRIGFPWSPHLVRRTLATTGGAIAAATSALQSGISGQLAGGTHHAHYNYGSCYCIFNDFAVASVHLLSSKQVQRVAIVDLDVHQGDGNASLLGERDDVFVFSMHGEKNFPFRKFESDLDMALPDDCGDELYIRKLKQGLEQVKEFHPDFVFYQAGVDALDKDKLGRLNLSMETLKERDEVLFAWVTSLGLPVSMGIGGGYSDPIDPTVNAYVQTYQVAKKFYNF